MFAKKFIFNIEGNKNIYYTPLPSFFLILKRTTTRIFSSYIDKMRSPSIHNFHHHSICLYLDIHTHSFIIFIIKTGTDKTYNSYIYNINQNSMDKIQDTALINTRQ